MTQPLNEQYLRERYRVFLRHRGETLRLFMQQAQESADLAKVWSEPDAEDYFLQKLGALYESAGVTAFIMNQTGVQDATVEALLHDYTPPAPQGFAP